MPNIWKRLSSPKVELFQFPDADEIVLEKPRKAAAVQSDVFPDFEQEDRAEQQIWPDESEQPEESPEPEEAMEPEAQPEPDPISFAQIQADSIVQDARRQAEEILAKARQEAEEEAFRIFEASRQSGSEAGYAEGLERGIAQAMEDNEIFRQEQARELGQEVQRFLEKAGKELDRQMDENVGQLRDLAIAVAEKVICISLKSSEGVIARMIQTALEKRKRREWVHIYIAECDAKGLTPMPAGLSSALMSISDRVRIIPMAEDESGTCIIEMPDEIIDASAGTQLNNIRSMLLDVDAPML